MCVCHTLSLMTRLSAPAHVLLCPACPSCAAQVSRSLTHTSPHTSPSFSRHCTNQCAVCCVAFSTMCECHTLSHMTRLSAPACVLLCPGSPSCAAQVSGTKTERTQQRCSPPSSQHPLSLLLSHTVCRPPQPQPLQAWGGKGADPWLPLGLQAVGCMQDR